MPRVKKDDAAPKPPHALHTIVTPARTMLLAEGSKAGHPDVHYLAVFTTSPIGAQPEFIQDNRASILFADGHVETREINAANWPARSGTPRDPGYTFWLGL